MNIVLDLQSSQGHPGYRMLSSALSNAIERGVLRAGDLLPSVRDLSSTLGMSRSTVLKAFEDLQSQGYIQSSRGVGTIVAHPLTAGFEESQLEEHSEIPEKLSIELSDYGKRLVSSVIGKDEEQRPADVFHGTPPLDLAAFVQWKQAMLKVCRLKDLPILSYSSDAFGHLRLREAIAAYLRRARAASCSAGEIIVFNDREARIDMLARVLLNPGDSVAVENPGYPAIRRQLIAQGIKIVPIPVDKDGMIIDELRSIKEKLKLICVTPSHHNPTGAVLSEQRRRELLAFARENGAFILEDDFGSEFRYAGTPLASLHGMDSADMVIHLHCFSKLLSPLMRLGFMTIPKRLKDMMRLAKEKTERGTSLVEQLAMTELLTNGCIERHLKRSRKIYATRRQTVIYALTKHLGNRVKLFPSISGTDLLISIRTDQDPDRVLRAAWSCGLIMSGTEQYYLHAAPEHQYLIPYGYMNQETASESIREFGKLLD